MFNKVIVIGCPGAGKSTFSRRLKSETGLPLYYLDMLWHKPDKTTISRSEFDCRLKEILSKDKWIIDGNYSRTLAMRLEVCDTVFLLDLPIEECLAAAEARIGSPREDMPWIETEFDKEFKQWILNFPQRELPLIYEQLSRFGEGKSITIFRSRYEIQKYFNKTFDR